METRLIIILCLITNFIIGQNSDEKDLSSYFLIKGEQSEFEGEVYKNIYPAIQKDTTDSIGVFLNKYPRRFSYILKNRTNKIYEDSTFQNLFPDTLKMSEVYRQQLKKNSIVLGYLNSFANPNRSLENKISFSNAELMKVASRFFLCNSVNPDTTIYWHVCIGLNGQKEAGWTRDFTMLEAFCFEAIFDGLQSGDQDKTRFMNNFLKFVKEAEIEFKDLSFELILKKASEQVFKKMENDNDLQMLLLDYYKKTNHQLPFSIE